MTFMMHALQLHDDVEYSADTFCQKRSEPVELHDNLANDFAQMVLVDGRVKVFDVDCCCDVVGVDGHSGKSVAEVVGVDDDVFACDTVYFFSLRRSSPPSILFHGRKLMMFWEVRRHGRSVSRIFRSREATWKCRKASAKKGAGDVFVLA